MKCSVKLSDGTRLRTRSTFRYVTFAISDDSRVTVLKRSDSFQTAKNNQDAAVRRGYCRVVTVDTHDAAMDGMFGGPIFDSSGRF